MTDKKLLEIISEFTKGLARTAKIKRIKNCLMMSQILQSHLNIFGIKTNLINVEVGEKKINHYCLLAKKETIIDATAWQFKGMPQIYIGLMPQNYHFNKIVW